MKFSLREFIFLHPGKPDPCFCRRLGRHEHENLEVAHPDRDFCTGLHDCRPGYLWIDRGGNVPLRVQQVGTPFRVYHS